MTESRAGTIANRGTRRRERTRSRLVEAARDLFSRKGVDATRIQEITEEADVGFGSFYNHFEDKDAIVRAVIGEVSEQQGTQVDQLTSNVEDPAEVVSVAHRHFLRLAQSDPVWGWLLIKLDASHSVLKDTLGPRALRDLEDGISAGRFTISDPVLAANATGGALLGTTRALLEGQLTDDADQQHAELVLKMLGVPPDEATEISRREFPIPEAD